MLSFGSKSSPLLPTVRPPRIPEYRRRSHSTCPGGPWRGGRRLEAGLRRLLLLVGEPSIGARPGTAAQTTDTGGAEVVGSQ
jgi:hypothetical protein